MPTTATSATCSSARPEEARAIRAVRQGDAAPFVRCFGTAAHRGEAGLAGALGAATPPLEALAERVARLDADRKNPEAIAWSMEPVHDANPRAHDYATLDGWTIPELRDFAKAWALAACSVAEAKEDRALGRGDENEPAYKQALRALSDSDQLVAAAVALSPRGHGAQREIENVRKRARRMLQAALDAE